jgi:hypothetical protein
MEDPMIGNASTAVGTLAVELGQPILWLIMAASPTFIVILMRASLRR